ncbi:MAG: bifunctional hydroxymethylpyrimidine kinase/phosphomethylpyrimidine kinase [Chloroflexi bacterium]|nr:bifunctional hydroxymethylpyrimidine kinase/phosphomethylpyrimidine kinase [Chloroflexota bacterium]MBP7041575.1 bifunctional hydroxymethylpyrimidine kinase/phosphomethylpyrimidine kinase [Chloroflexota bacterium]
MDQNLPPKLLTIAGSDSGGAAGLQADLRAWAVLGAYGLSVITAVTAQNSLAVHAIQFMPPDLIAAQLESVLSDYGADAAKTGFLGRVAAIEAVADSLRRFAVPHLVVDPVLVNHQGAAMFDTAVTAAYLAHLLPLAGLLTPNPAEAALLLNMDIRCLADGETAVRRLHTLGPKTILLKRIPAGGRLVDLFFDGAICHRLPTAKIETANTHGSGDVFSAAVCAHLARGDGMETAVRQAQTFTANAIQNSAHWPFCAGHGPVWPHA